MQRSSGPFQQTAGLSIWERMSGGHAAAAGLNIQRKFKCINMWWLLKYFFPDALLASARAHHKMILWPTVEKTTTTAVDVIISQLTNIPIDVNANIKGNKQHKGGV